MVLEILDIPTIDWFIRLEVYVMKLEKTSQNILIMKVDSS